MTSPSNEFVPVLKYAVQTVGTCNLKKDGTRADRGRIEDGKRRGQDEDDRPITFWDEDGRSLRFWETD